MVRLFCKVQLEYYCIFLFLKTIFPWYVLVWNLVFFFHYVHLFFLFYFVWKILTICDIVFPINYCVFFPFCLHFHLNYYWILLKKFILSLYLTTICCFFSCLFRKLLTLYPSPYLIQFLIVTVLILVVLTIYHSSPFWKQIG